MVYEQVHKLLIFRVRWKRLRKQLKRVQKFDESASLDFSLLIYLRNSGWNSGIRSYFSYRLEIEPKQRAAHCLAPEIFFLKNVFLHQDSWISRRTRKATIYYSNYQASPREKFSFPIHGFKISGGMDKMVLRLTLFMCFACNIVHSVASLFRHESTEWVVNEQTSNCLGQWTWL